jgi:protein-tyrosine-phosphatase/DNA-binding transcriptional ArsR family regulator
VFAALGEPGRLAIVDHLGVTDASPGELAELLGMGTNLLSHHLRVLEEAGIIRRDRSEGDRRRNYVQLRLDNPTVRHALAGTDTGAVLTSAVPRVLFVCTANSARSQLAAADWSRVSSIPAASAGTHPAPRVHPRAVAVGRRHGLRLGRAVTHGMAAVGQPGDLVVAVCDNAFEELTAASRRPSLHWAVPDPVRADTDEAFETAYQQIAGRVDHLAAAVHGATAQSGS